MSSAYSNLELNNIIRKFQDNKKKEAYSDIKKYILSNTNDLIALYNYAYMSEKINETKTAIKIYKQIIQKDNTHWRSIFNLYLIYINQKKYDESLNLINHLLLIKPDYAPALRDKALVMFYLKKIEDGLTLINKSLKINPNDYLSLNILGLIYGELKLEKKALEVFKIAIQIKPDYFASYNNLGNILQNLGEIDLSLHNFNKAIELNKKFAEGYNNIGNIYNLKSKYHKAIKFYKNALDLDPANPTMIYNIGVTYSYLKEYEKAERYYSKSLKINPNSDVLKKNFSILYLAKHEFKKAWEYYDGRLNLNDFAIKNSSIYNIRNKLWQGEKILPEHKILIIKEQGVGDEILHSSMYPDLLKAFPLCHIETEERLLSLFERSFKTKKNFHPLSYFSKNIKKINNFDKILYSGSLARLFRNKLSDFPNKKYLFAKKEKKNSIMEEIKKINSHPNIGLTWESKRPVYGNDKSVDLGLLLPILKIKKFNFINLQYGDTLSTINNFQNTHKINIKTFPNIDLYNDFENIAALLTNLDLFITVSNTTAHLAGALGISTWLIKPKNHAVFHYWNQPNSNTPWYPSVKIFEFSDNWENTIKNIKDAFNKKFEV